MRARARTSLACLLALAISFPHLASAQEPAPAAAAAPSLAGGWNGWAKLTNEWPGLTCRYESGPDAETVHLELNGEAGHLRGSLAIDVPAAAGSGCPALRKRCAIEEVTEAPGTVAFTDSGGNEWTLAVRRQGEVLQGLLAWRAGGPDQPLAEGFTSPDGQRPLSRLSGEVRLRRGAVEPEQGRGTPAASAGGGAAAGGGGAASAPRKTSAGTHLKHLAIVLGANAVGLGLFYGVNRLGKGSSTSGTLTCSPRLCRAGVPGQPCFCDPSQDTGVSCGTTTGGVDLNGACDGKTLLCRSGLSCDILQGASGGVCEDPKAGGRCP
jgi:hypothetical protein